MPVTETEVGTWMVADVQVTTVTEDDEWIHFPSEFFQAYSTGMHIEANISPQYLKQIEVRIDPSAEYYYILYASQVLQLSTFTTPKLFKQTVESWVNKINSELSLLTPTL